MRRPATLPAFTAQEKAKVHELLGSKVASMMGRKFEEGDWAEIYCRAKGIPNAGWSNLKLDVIHKGLGIEHKMLCYRKRPDITNACGTTLMHPSATRSFRVPSSQSDPNDAMRSVLNQYAEFIEGRRGKVQETAQPGTVADLRTGWLLWQEGLREFVYYEEEMLPPNPDDYEARWDTKQSKGSRKASTNLWVYERETGRKRYSVTTEAGAKIQPYFDVPPPNDPNLYVFTVIGEVLDTGFVRVWLSDATLRELERLVGSTDVEAVSNKILSIAATPSLRAIHEQLELYVAQPIQVTLEAYDFLKQIMPKAVSDEHSFQLLTRYLRGTSQ